MALVGRHIVKRVLRIVLILMAFGSVLAGTLIWWVVVHPDDAWRFGRRYLVPDDLHVTWTEMHFHPQMISWRQWNIDWSVVGLNVEKDIPRVRAPIERVAVQFGFTLFSPRTLFEFANVSVVAIRPITVDLGQFKNDSPEQSFYQSAREYLDYVAMGNHLASIQTFDISIKQFGIAGLKISGEAKKTAGEEATAVPFDLHVDGPALNLEFRGSFDPAQIEQTSPVLDGKLHFAGSGARLDGRVSLSFAREVFLVGLNGSLGYRRPPGTIRFNPDLKINLSRSELGVDLVSDVKGLPGGVPDLSRYHLTSRLPQKDGVTWADGATPFSLRGEMPLFFVEKRWRKALEEASATKIPSAVNLELSGQLRARNLVEALRGPAIPDDREIAEIRLAADELKNNLFGLKVAADLTVGRAAGVWKFKPRLDSALHLYHYQTLRRMLDQRNVMIPSPFDVLDGTLDIVARGGSLEPNNHARLPIDISAALASDHQNIKLRAGLFLDAGPSFKNIDAFVKVAIDALKIQLPPLDPLAGMPKVVGDPRIQIVAPQPVVVKNKPAIKTRLYVEAKTTTPGAIELLTTFAKPSIPISVEVTRAMDEALVGSVQLEPFRLQYLRRVVNVEHMRLLMADRDQADYPVDGRFRIDQTQYKVFVDVGGTLRQPLIRFSSDPELPKKDIISVLLFDHVAEESADAETAGSFESAVADRAIGLFGIWAFASTPIRSFSYNPVTKVYAATVQLADGLTAGIGTNWEEAAHLEVRKRISKRWVLTASWAPGDADASQVGKLVLQWEKRF